MVLYGESEVTARVKLAMYAYDTRIKPHNIGVRQSMYDTISYSFLLEKCKRRAVMKLSSILKRKDSYRIEEDPQQAVGYRRFYRFELWLL